MLEALLKSMGFKKEHLDAMIQGIEETRQNQKDIKVLLENLVELQKETNYILRINL